MRTLFLSSSSSSGRCWSPFRIGCSRKHSPSPSPSSLPPLCRQWRSFIVPSSSSSSSSSYGELPYKPRHCCHFSSAATAAVPVETALKRFYKLVHPDLFTAYPDKKKTNSESFALLQHYLASVKEPTKFDSSESPQGSLKSFSLKFFSTKSPSVPTCVEIEPFHPQDSQSKRERHLHRTLVNVFSACGYDPGPIDTQGYAGPATASERYAKPGELTLVKFLMSLSNRRRKSDKQKQAEAHTQQQLTQYASSLASTHHLREFSFDLKELMFLDTIEKGNRKLALLLKFKAAIEDLVKKGEPLENLKGAVISFGRRKSNNNLDSRGRLVLSSEQSVEEWSEVLQSYTDAAAQLSIRYARNRIQKENDIASLLSLSKFYSDPELEMSYSYEALLNNILRDMRPGEFMTKHNLPTSLKLRISQETVSMEPQTCTLLAPVNISPSNLLELLNEHSKKTIQQFSVFKDAVEKLKDQYNLPSLTYQVPPDLTDDQLWECFNRLVKSVGTFSPYLRGLRIHIGNEYGFNEDSSVVSIRWDYSID